MKTRIIAVCVILTICISAFFGAEYAISASAAPVQVVPVADVNSGWYGTSVSMNGNVSTRVTQEIYGDDAKIISRIDVAEGDSVDIGTPLVEYDMTMAELNL